MEALYQLSYIPIFVGRFVARQLPGKAGLGKTLLFVRGRKGEGGQGSHIDRFSQQAGRQGRIAAVDPGKETQITVIFRIQGGSKAPFAESEIGDARGFIVRLFLLSELLQEVSHHLVHGVAAASSGSATGDVVARVADASAPGLQLPGEGVRSVTESRSQGFGRTVLRGLGRVL